MKAEDILKATSGRLLCGSQGTTFSGISTDTRTIREGELFIAIKGERYDGHDFLYQAFQKGAKGLLVELSRISHFDRLPHDITTIAVEDTVKALGDIGAWWRKQFDTFVIAITGSTGKTTTKEILSKILSCAGKTHYSEGNLNNLIGVPINLIKIQKDHIYSVIEIAMNRVGEIRRLTEISDPNMGIITNVGPAHIENLGSLKGVILAKLELVQAIHNGHQTLIDGDNLDLLEEAKKINKPIVTVGYNPKNDYVISHSKSDNYFILKVSSQRHEKNYEFKFNLQAYSYVRNALTACVAALCLGIEPHLIQQGLNNFRGVKRRFQVTHIVNDSILVDDSYNSNPLSLKAGLLSLRELFPDHYPILVIGDMLELGSDSKDYHRKAGQLCGDFGPCTLIAVGQYGQDIMNGALQGGLKENSIHVVKTIDEAFPLVAKYFRPKSVLYLKGSNKVNLHKLADFILEHYKVTKES